MTPTQELFVPAPTRRLTSLGTLFRRSRKTAVACMFVAMLGQVFTPAVRAADQFWVGGPTDANWNTPDNWFSGVAPGDTASTTNPDIAWFNAPIANGWGTIGTPIIIDSATQYIMAPMPRASEATATMRKMGERVSVRSANVRS